MRALVEDAAWEVRAEAARALGEIAPADRAVVDALGRALGDPHGRVRRAAVVSLRGAGPEAETAVGLLRTLLETEADPGLVLVPAIHVMASLGGAEAVATLTRLLRHRRADVREEAARALGEMGPAARAAAPGLRELLTDEQDRPRQAAMRALRRILGTPAPSDKER
jgi:HEAT repeat protein